MLDLFVGVLEGLKTLHSRGYMHRDVTVRNMLVMSEYPPQGVLCDFGKTILGDTYTSKSAGPAATRAPEIDGIRPYNNAVDIWSCGYAFSRVLIPDLTSTTGHNNHGGQSEDWIRRVSQKLDELGDQSLLHRRMTDLVKAMLAFRPEDRPTIVNILRCWPAKQFLFTTLASDDESPPRKFQKGLENTKVARP